MHRYETVESLDYTGKFLLPGLIDSHLHLLLLGESFLNLNLLQCRSIADLKQALGTYVKPNTESDKKSTVFGFGWDDEKYGDHRLPTRDDIDAVCSDRPVILFRVCGHIAVVNSRALEICKVPQVKSAAFLRGCLFFTVFCSG